MFMAFIRQRCMNCYTLIEQHCYHGVVGPALTGLSPSLTHTVYRHRQAECEGVRAGIEQTTAL